MENVFLKYEFSRDVFVGRLIDYAVFRNITSEGNFQNVTRENSLLLLTPLWFYIKPEKFDKSFTAQCILKLTTKIIVYIYHFKKTLLDFAPDLTFFREHPLCFCLHQEEDGLEAKLLQHSQVSLPLRHLVLGGLLRILVFLFAEKLLKNKNFLTCSRKNVFVSM